MSGCNANPITLRLLTKRIAYSNIRLQAHGCSFLSVKQRLRVVVSLCNRRSVSGHTFDSILLTTINVAPVVPTHLADLGMVMSDRRIDDQAFTCKTVVNE